MNYTYVLECGDGSLYAGWTNDIEKRLAAHRSGEGAKYTRGRGPLRLVCLEVFDTKEEAMRREAHIKHLSRAEKLALIEAGDWREHLAEWQLEGLDETDGTGREIHEGGAAPGEKGLCSRGGPDRLCDRL